MQGVKNIDREEGLQQGISRVTSTQFFIGCRRDAINSFDQWGVELGKQLAGRRLPALQGVGDAAGLDPSTRALIAWCRERGGF